MQSCLQTKWIWAVNQYVICNGTYCLEFVLNYVLSHWKDNPINNICLVIVVIGHTNRVIFTVSNNFFARTCHTSESKNWILVTIVLRPSSEVDFKFINSNIRKNFISNTHFLSKIVGKSLVIFSDGFYFWFDQPIQIINDNIFFEIGWQLCLLGLNYTIEGGLNTVYNKQIDFSHKMMNSSYWYIKNW